jgi:tetratricopeptide (TPR) repeat protein
VLDALLEYSNRLGIEDFSSLIRFLEVFPQSPWKPGLLVDLGLEYYKTGRYSQALDAWHKAWELSKTATDPKGKALADRAGGELAYMYARLGRVTELDALLKSVKSRVFSGPATEMITGAREGLWNMRNRPEISFRCGPLALHRIMLTSHPENPKSEMIDATSSTQRGFSLHQVAKLSYSLGLNAQCIYFTTVKS